ncbi:MAG: DUF2911 domain-containing protein [Myxococcales bacterium]|nr:DUF2911 domain-containing protein [Myxococcales bacterium]
MSWKKILLTIFLGAVVIFGIALAYMVLTTRSHSPAETITYSGGNMKVIVTYCRPYKKGRVIFGTKNQGALQPYGEYWRVGANEATEIEFSKDVSVMGKSLAAGRYVLYAVPGESEWTIGFNSDLGRWGYMEVDHRKDILQVTAPHQYLPKTMEQFTIDFTEQEQGVFLNLKWDQSFIPVSIDF